MNDTMNFTTQLNDALDEAIELPLYGMDFLLSTYYHASRDRIKSDFILTDDETVFLSDLDRMVLAGRLNLRAYLVAVDDEFTERLNEERRDALLAQLLAERFLPLGDALNPSAEEVAKAEGLKLPTTSYYRVYSTPLSFSGAATEISKMVGFSLMGGSSRDRLRELIVNKTSGKMLDAQVRDTLMRAVDLDGLGLDAKAAERTVVAMNDLAGRVKLMSEEAYSNWLADRARGVEADDETSPDVAALGTVSPSPSRMPTELDAAVDAILKRLVYKTPNDYLAKRLLNIVSSRLRDVRDKAGARQLLLRDIKVGGMGLDGATADAIVNGIEAGYAEFHERIAGEEKAKIDKELSAQKLRVEDRRRKEAEEHAKWFEEKVRAKKAGELRGSTVHPVEQKNQAMQTKRLGEMVAAPTAAKPIVAQTKPAVVMSPVSAGLATAVKNASRPPIDGVTYAGPQLVGLVGELRSLNLAEYRRMDKNPQEATKKIAQKIEILGQESLEKRIEGIKALQASPLQAAYLTLVSESFRSAKPIVALAEEKRKAGQDTLSPDEIAAIISLNSALHF